jgi:hypothetical protein
LAVLLVLVDVVGGHIRAGVSAWLLAVSVTFLVGPTTSFLTWPAEWGSSKGLVAPAVLLVLAVALGSHVARHGVRRSDLVWVASATGVLLAWWRPLSVHVAPAWWQVALVGTGIALAAAPLRALIVPRRAAAEAAAPLLSSSRL